MWHGVLFARQRRPIIGVLRMCWLLPGSFDCFCCPHTSVHRPSIACLAVFLCGPGALFLHALSRPSTICPFPPHSWSAPDGLPLLPPPRGRGSSEQSDNGPTLTYHKHVGQWLGTRNPHVVRLETRTNAHFLSRYRGTHNSVAKFRLSRRWRKFPLAKSGGFRSAVCAWSSVSFGICKGGEIFPGEIITARHYPPGVAERDAFKRREGVSAMGPRPDPWRIALRWFETAGVGGGGGIVWPVGICGWI